MTQAANFKDDFRLRRLTTSIVAMAISAVDCALWDLKAKILDISLATLLGPVRAAVPIYGSGGFTSYSDPQLQQQLSGWAEQGIPRVKMKDEGGPRSLRRS